MPDSGTGEGEGQGAAHAYHEYVGLPELLDLIRPRTAVPVERHFLVATQAMELCFALISADWSRARAALDEDRLADAVAGINLADRAWQGLAGLWPLVDDIDPETFASFRPTLGPASGLHSFGFRMVELVAGLRVARVLVPYRGLGRLEDELRAELGRPSLYDAANAYLARAGVPTHEGLPAAWRLAATRAALAELSQALLAASDRLAAWRERHLVAVRRSIGDQQGTAGTTGTAWLADRGQPRAFPDLVAALAD